MSAPTQRRGLLPATAGVFTLLLAGAAVGWAARAHAAPRPAGQSSRNAKAASLFAADKGQFRILVNGQQVGKEDFEISPKGDHWMARGNTEIQGAQGGTHISGTLEFGADGAPLHYEWATQGAKKAGATIAFSGATANIEVRLEGSRPFTQQFTFESTRVAILDDNLYHQYTLLAGLYNWDKKGAQTLSVLVPQEMAPGTVTVESLGSQDLGGKKVEELRVQTEDLEVDLFLDGRRVVRIVAPASNAEIIRE